MESRPILGTVFTTEWHSEHVSCCDCRGNSPSIKWEIPSHLLKNQFLCSENAFKYYSGSWLSQKGFVQSLLSDLPLLFFIKCLWIWINSCAYFFGTHPLSTLPSSSPCISRTLISPAYCLCIDSLYSPLAYFSSFPAVSYPELSEAVHSLCAVGFFFPLHSVLTSSVS